MEVHIENQQKQFEELQINFNARVQECSDLIDKLDSTQNNLNQTSKDLSDAQEEVKRCQYAIKERDFIIFKLKKAENALANQACVLRSELERSLKDNASLFMKIDEFKKAYEEHSKSDAQKLIAEVKSLVSNHTCHQKEMVDARSATIRETAAGSKKVLEHHVSSFDWITSNAKGKWQDFSMQLENDAKENADFAAAKHCHFELVLQKCVNVTESALNRSKTTCETVIEMGKQHVTAVDALVRNAIDDNDHHYCEITPYRQIAEDGVLKTGEDLSKHTDCTSEQERKVISLIHETTKSQFKNLESLHEDYASQSSLIEQKVHDTFHRKYMDYEPSGSTPIRNNTYVPSKVSIESLRTKPMESLSVEFRENHSFESFERNESKICSTPRPPLAQIN